MDKQANIRNVTVTSHLDNRGKSMLQDFLIREAGIIIESTSERLEATASGCVDKCVTLKSLSCNV